MVDMESPYNAILGRPWLHMQVVPSTYHQLVQCPSDWDNRHQRGPSYVQNHFRHRQEEVWLEAKDYKDSLQRRFPHGQEAKVASYTIAITKQ